LGLGTDHSAHLDLLQVDIVRADREVVLDLGGELDVASADHLREGFRRASRLAAENVLLDLDQLEFMDASGLHVIVEAAARLGDRLWVRPGTYVPLFTLGGVLGRLQFLAPAPAAPAHELAIRNIGYMRALYSVWHTQGIDAMVALVPEDVDWQPSEAEGRVLRGSDELLEFWDGARPVPVAEPAWFTAVGEDVIIESAHQVEPGAITRIYSLYEFSGPRLVKATAVDAGH
jgi:hypothetical protein